MRRSCRADYPGRPVDLLLSAVPALTLRGNDDWENLTRDEQRDLIRFRLDRAVVAPGRGSDRITVYAR